MQLVTKAKQSEGWVVGQQELANAETIIAEVAVISEQKREEEPTVKKPRHPAEVAKANQNLQVRGDVLRVCRGHNVLMLFSDSQRQETSSSTPWRGEKGKSEQS